MSDTDRAVLQLKVSRDKLRRYKAKLEKENALLDARARAMVRDKKQKEAALTLLKMKRYKDKQCAQLEGQLDNVNQTLASVITAEMTVRMMQALEQGTRALQRLNEEMPLEKIDELMDDTAEAIAYQQEVSTLLAGSLTGEDVSDVDDELESMMKEIDQQGGTAATEIHLPKAPTGEVKIKIVEDATATAAAAAVAPVRQQMPA